MLIGVCVTAMGCVLSLLHLYDGLRNVGYDLLFRHFSYIDAHPDITLVDIDDGSIRSVSGWPWPRRRYAQLIDNLSAAGAKAIVLDLVLAEPTSPRPIHAGLGPHYDVDPALSILGDPSHDPPIFDDDELRDSIKKAGNVYLAMYFPLYESNRDPHRIEALADSILKETPAIARTEFNQKMINQFATIAQGDDLTNVPFAQLFDRSQIRHQLLQDFKLEESDLVHRLEGLGVDRAAVIEQLLPDAKQSTARTVSRRFVEENPSGTFRQFIELVLPDSSFDTISSDRETLLHAYRESLSWIALTKLHPAVSDSLLGRIPNGGELTLPLEKFAQVAKGIGFVTFDRESSGAVVREMPLIAHVETIQVAQLAFLVAADQLGFDRQSAKLDQNRLWFSTATHHASLPYSPQGKTPINWHRPHQSNDWRDSFSHLPAARILEPSLNREAMADNEKIYRLTLAHLVQIRHLDTPAEYSDYVTHINRRLEMRQQTDPLQIPAKEKTQELEQLAQSIAAAEREALVWLDRRKQLFEPFNPTTQAERTQRDEIMTLYTDLREGNLTKRIQAINQRLRDRNNKITADISERIKGKICIVGYTASGSGDLVSSPVYRSLPGAMVHANLLNTLLSRAPILRASSGVNLFLIAISGLILTLATTTLRPLTSLLVLFVFLMVSTLLGILLFKTVGFTFATLVLNFHCGGVWASVAAYRQFTEERARRRFQLALAQYTSPAVAAQIAESGAKEDLDPQSATVTCFFSDLEGFTNLSERLGAEKTRLVLNPYLRVMSEVLIEHGAIVNKFIGDGIFAFFNAPIRPQNHHPASACDSALACLKALSTLHVSDSIAGAPLRMRMGLSTGDVFVGDYGSDTKLDYTCIGDTVNLGARLERLNKKWGTLILTDENTRRQAGDRFLFRNLGRVLVAGKSRPVDIYELRGYENQTPSQDQEYCTTFESVVRHYQDRDWEGCRQALDRCHALHNNTPDHAPDPAIKIYNQAINQFRTTPPPGDWDQTVSVP